MREARPSRTAYKVALSLVTLNAVPGMNHVLPPGIVDATAQLLIASGAASPRAVRWSRSRRMVSVYKAFDCILPGQFEAFAHRKAFCEHQVREGIAEGATQILVLGAGYDTLGWRLAPEFPNIHFFEIDHPATAALKAKGIAAMGERPNLHLIAADLSKRALAEVLESHAVWQPQARTVILAEGLVMYLPSEAVEGLFRQCAAIADIGSRIALSYIPAGVDGQPDVGRWSGLMRWLQTVLGEPWIWSIRPEQLGRFLEELGWRHAPELLQETGKQGVEFYSIAILEGRGEAP